MLLEALQVRYMHLYTVVIMCKFEHLAFSIIHPLKHVLGCACLLSYVER